MSAIIPFESNSNLPSFIDTSAASSAASLANFGTSMGFPVLSIKSKVFTLKRGDEKTLITKPGEDDPASSIEVVILGAGPAGNNNAKVYYGKGYTEGSDDKPLCSSADGISPLSDSEKPQAKKCALCPHNQFGSRITEDGKQAKMCQDSKRLAIAAVGSMNDPMLLRVPATSLKALRELNSTLSKRGLTDSLPVIVKVGFDYSVSHPALTFKPIGFVDQQTYFEAKQESTGDTVQMIIGAKTFSAPVADDFESVPAPEYVEEKPAPKKEAAPKKEKPAAKPVDDDLPTEAPKAKVRVEAEKPKAEPVEESSDALDDALDMDIDFDD